MSRISGGIQAIQTETQKLNAATLEATKLTSGFIMTAVKYFTVYAALAKIVDAFGNALEEMKAVDKELTNIQKVSNIAGAELDRLGDKAYSTASKYGVAASEYLSAVYTFQKAGLGDSSEKLGELATKTMLVGDTTADVASQFLIAVNAAWELGGSMTELSKIVDEADYINNNYATSLDKLSAGMPIVASTAANLGMSVEQTLAVLGTITAKTQETGTKAATAWRALAMNITGEIGTIYDETGEAIEVTEESVKSISAALKIYGNEAVQAAQKTGKIINPMDAVISLAQAYKDNLLTDIELEKILMKVGGKLRTNQLTALVKDLASETSTYYDIMSKLPDAAGTADTEIGIMLSSWESKAQILKNTWTDFIQKSLNTDSFKGFLDGLTKLLGYFDNLGSAARVLSGLLLAVFSKQLVTQIAAITTQIIAAGGAMNALKSAASSASVELAAIGIGFTVYMAVLQGVISSHNKAIKAAEEQYETDKKTISQLDDLIERYKELGENGVDTSERETVKGIEEEILDLLGDQATAIDLVNGKYEEQLGILEDINEKQILAAQADAISALEKYTTSRTGIGKIQWGVLGKAGANELQEYRELRENLSAFENIFPRRQGGDNNFIPADTAEEIAKQYADVLTLIDRYQTEYAGRATDLAHNSIYKNLQTIVAELGPYVEAYNEAMALGNEEEAAEALEEAAEAAENATDGYGELEAGINAVTKAKKKMDEAMADNADEDEAFQSISEAVKDFREMIDSGEINSRAFWNTAEFLFGPDVLAKYAGNAKGLVELFKNSNLEEVFDGESLDGFIKKLREVDDEIAEVTDWTDGSTSYMIHDIDKLAEAWGMTTDQVFALMEASEAFGALHFEGNGLIDYLEYLGVEFENGKANIDQLAATLESVGYQSDYIESVVEQLEAMGAVDMSETQKGTSEVADSAGDADERLQKAKAAVESLDSTTLANIYGQIDAVTVASDSLGSSIGEATQKAKSLDGTTITVTTNYVTTGAVPQTFAEGTSGSGALGGPALVGDEYSADGRPKPELIVDRGRAYLGGLNGPEIVNLSRGSQVYPYEKTKAMLGAAKLTTAIPAYALGASNVSTNVADSGGGGNAKAKPVYYIYFNANGGSGALRALYGTAGTSVTIPSTRPTRSGYTFRGWAWSKNAASPSLQPGGKATIAGYNRTLYALWQKNASSVSSGGSYTTSTSTSSGGGGGGGGGGSSGTTSTPDKRDTLMDEIKAALQDREFAIWQGQKTGDLSNGEIVNMYQSAMALVNTYIDKYRAMGEDENSDYIQELKKQWWEYSDEIGKIQDDLVEEMKTTVSAQLDEAADARDRQIQAIRDQADAEEELNALEEKRKALLEAQEALLNAQSERTIRIYNAATGQWEWVANAADVRQAQEAAQDAQKALNDEIAAQVREAQIDALNGEYDALQARYDAILDALKDPNRDINAILSDAKNVGTEKNAAAIGNAATLSESIAAAILRMNTGATVTSIDGKTLLYGATNYAAGGGITIGGTTSTGAGGTSYYINGVEISADRAETLTVAELARTLSTLAIYNNT